MTQHPSDSAIQRKVEKHLHDRLVAGELTGSPIELGFSHSYLQFDGYNPEERVVVEIVSRIGSTSSSRDDKVMSDAMKMLFLEKETDAEWRKYLVTNDERFAQKFTHDKSKLRSKWQAKALAKFGIVLVTLKISESLIAELLLAQKLQAEGIKG